MANGPKATSLTEGEQRSNGKENLLLLMMVVAAVIGVLIGYYAPHVGANYLKVFGELFLAALKTAIVPLVIFTIIHGVASLGDVRKIGKFGGGTVAYYMCTTFIAVFMGLILVNVVAPGQYYTPNMDEAGEAAAAKLEQRGEYELHDAINDIILNFFSENIVESMANLDVLPIIIFSLILGGILTTVKKGKAVLEIVEGLNDAIIIYVRLVIFFLAPIGILGLVASKLGEARLQGQFFEAMQSLGAYAATVIAGLAIHGLIVLPLVFWIFTRKNPYRFLGQMLKAMITAFATGSSSATLPVTMECLTENAKVSERSTGFVSPLGATINMDGTALYEAVAVMFIAQSLGYTMDISQQVVIFFTATLAAVGAASIPEAGLVTMILVLKAVGLPLEGIGLILIIDWFLDRCRTTVNVFGDAVGSAVMENFLPPDQLADKSEGVISSGG